MFRVLILESDSFTAKGLKALASEVSIDLEIDYALTAERALKAAEARKFDLFVIGISSAEEDIGLCFTRMIAQTKEYKMTPIIFLMSALDNEIKQIILDEFIGPFRLLTKPISEKIEEAFKDTVSTYSAYKILRSDEHFITMICDGNEKNINLSDILWVDIEDKIVSINMVDGKALKYPHSDYSIKRLRVMLGEGFLHIHRSTIVNKRYVKRIDYEEKWLNLEGVERAFKLGGTHLFRIKGFFGDRKN